MAGMQDVLSKLDSEIKELIGLREAIVKCFKQNGNLKKSPARRRRTTSRKDQLVRWLKANGPARRVDLKQSKIPTGTINLLLRDRKRFQKKDGRWIVRAK